MLFLKREEWITAFLISKNAPNVQYVCLLHLFNVFNLKKQRVNKVKKKKKNKTTVLSQCLPDVSGRWGL